jgi:hypothetical protein
MEVVEVSDTAFRYPMSSVVKMDVVEEKGVKVIELEFKFAKYQLILDDETNTKKFIELIMGKVIWPEKEKSEKENVKLPKFYQGPEKR